MPTPIRTQLQDAYDHVPAPVVARARLQVVPFLTPGTGAMTLGRLILVRRGREDDVVLLAHELVHVQQYTEHGFFGFLARYVGSYFPNLVRKRSHRAAYLAIPFEADARRLANRWAAAHPELAPS